MALYLAVKCQYYQSAKLLNRTNFCRVAKWADGAVFNVQNNIFEVILGVPSLSVTIMLITVKYYLKAICNPGGDIHCDFIDSEMDFSN